MTEEVIRNYKLELEFHRKLFDLIIEYSKKKLSPESIIMFLELEKLGLYTVFSKSEGQDISLAE